MDRRIYLVSYDVADPSLLRKVRDLVKGYAVGGQKSFYECWMTEPEARYLFGRLSQFLDPATDKAHIFQLDPRKSVILKGCAKRLSYEPFMVV